MPPCGSVNRDRDRPRPPTMTMAVPISVALSAWPSALLRRPARTVPAAQTWNGCPSLTLHAEKTARFGSHQLRCPSVPSPNTIRTKPRPAHLPSPPGFSWHASWEAFWVVAATAERPAGARELFAPAALRRPLAAPLDPQHQPQSLLGTVRYCMYCSSSRSSRTRHGFSAGCRSIGRVRGPSCTRYLAVLDRLRAFVTWNQPSAQKLSRTLTVD